MSLVEGVESGGKKTKEKEHDIGTEDVQMEGAGRVQTKWKPRPAFDALDPIEIEPIKRITSYSKSKLEV